MQNKKLTSSYDWAMATRFLLEITHHFVSDSQSSQRGGDLAKTNVLFSNEAYDGCSRDSRLNCNVGVFQSQ